VRIKFRSKFVGSINNLKLLSKVEARIKKMIQTGEHQQLDFKYEISDSRKIAKSLVAFANTDGGILLIGVKDNGAIAGVRSDEEFYMVEAAAQLYSKPEIEFSTKSYVVNGKTVLEIIIHKSKIRPHFAKDYDDSWKAYVRVNDENFEANRILLEVWKQENNKQGIFLEFSEKEKVLLNYLENNAEISISKFCRIAYLPIRRAEKILVKLILLDIIKMQISQKGVLYSLKNRS